MKFIGFLIVVLILLMGFSMLSFLATITIYWLTLRQVPKWARKVIGNKELKRAE